MKRITIPLSAALALLAAAAPVLGQTLAERIDAVRREHREAAAPRTSAVRLLQALLYKPVSTDFERTPVRDVLDYLARVLDVNLVARYLDDATGVGIDPETPISLKLADLRAVEVLDLVLEQCAAAGEAATWQLRPGFIEVGPKERLSAPSARVTRTYPIDDLLFEPADVGAAPVVGLGPNGYDGIHTSDYYDPYGPYGGFIGRRAAGSFGPAISRDTGPSAAERREERARALVELIVSTIEPAAWPENGGDWATIRYHEGALVVNAPDFIHRQIGGYPRVPPPRAARRTPGTWGTR